MCNSFLYTVGSSIFFPFFVIILIIGCFFVIKKVREDDLPNDYKFFIFLIFLCLFIFVLLVFFSLNATGCTDKTKHLSRKEINLINKKKLEKNHIIVMGDSRMDFLRNERDKIDVPKYVSFIALSGAKYDWFSTDAIDELEKELDEKQNKEYYHVIIDFGVNDLNDEEEVSKHEKEYFDRTLALAKKYHNVDFYYLSVNPIEPMIKDHFPGHRSNTKIKEFNYLMKQDITLSSLNNLWYCNSYDHVKFKTYDGLHYDTQTNKRIINYIDKQCVLRH